MSDPLDPAAPRTSPVAISVRGIVVEFGARRVLDHLDLDVMRGEVLGFVGGSGVGKSVLTRAILGLVERQAGTVTVFGEDMGTATAARRRAIAGSTRSW